MLKFHPPFQTEIDQDEQSETEGDAQVRQAEAVDRGGGVRGGVDGHPTALIPIDIGRVKTPAETFL